MASLLYKIGGLEIVEVVDPPPTDNTTPLLPPSNVNDPNIPSPISSPGDFLPLKDESVPRPTPDGNTKVTSEEEYIYVFFPANPLIAGSQDRWVPYTRSQYNQLVKEGAIVP
jgi:hypothetical protein